MMRPDAQLAATIFDTPELKPTRDGFGEGLVLAGEHDPQVVALCADLTESTRVQAFAQKFPNRFVEIGVAEQNLASVASGMAAMGKVPFVASYAVFSPGRNWEQIRTTICYNNANVKIIGAHAGVSVGPDGGSHQALEDIAIMRVLPRMTVLYPCDAIEARKATMLAATLKGPVYIRLGREKTPIITTDATPFVIGKSQVFWESEQAVVGIIATGPLVHNALVAAKELAAAGVAVKVLHLATIKPLDEAGILSFVQGLRGVVTAEEHQVHGGMGSAVAELLVEHNPLPMRFIGVHDMFGQSGKPNELIAHYGMDVSAITAAVRDLLK